MKKYLLALSVTIAIINANCFYKEKYQEPQISGAWQYVNGDIVETMIIQKGYFSKACYDQATHKFINARGGKCSFDENSLKYNLEFDTEDRNAVKNVEEYAYSTESNGRVMRLDGKDWIRIDGGYGSQPALGGIWKTMSQFSSSAKTLQILSGKRFQRFDIDPDKAEFYNTIGGSYSFNDGIYTEIIEFASADTTEIGHVRSYESQIEKNIWRYRSVAPMTTVNVEWTRAN